MDNLQYYSSIYEGHPHKAITYFDDQALQGIHDEQFLVANHASTKIHASTNFSLYQWLSAIVVWIVTKTF